MANADIPEPLRRLEIPGRATLVEGNGDLPRIEVTARHSKAEIYLHGAHVTDFQAPQRLGNVSIGHRWNSAGD